MAENDELVSAACPQCGAEFQVPLSANGMTGECSVCGAQFVIAFEMAPAEEVSAPAEPEAPAPAEETPAPAEPEVSVPVEPEPAHEEKPVTVPEPEPAPIPQAPAPAPSAPKPIPSALKAPGGAKTWNKPTFTPENEMVSTNTIKLSRIKPPTGSTGLLPDVKDDKFKIGVIQPAAQMAQLGGTTQRKFSSGNFAPKKPAKKPWWERLMFWK